MSEKPPTSGKPFESAEEKYKMEKSHIGAIAFHADPLGNLKKIRESTISETIGVSRYQNPVSVAMDQIEKFMRDKFYAQMDVTNPQLESLGEEQGNIFINTEVFLC